VEVKKGENLSLIASRYPGVTAEGLMKANQIDDPHSIQIGQKIWIPGGFKGVSHRVQEGETISELVSRYNVPSAMRVCDLNGFPRS
jgi:LysM repeat protein